MLTRITLNGVQVSHGNNLTEALEMLVDDGHKIHPITVRVLFDGKTMVQDEHGQWQVETEPAMTGELVRAACESDISFFMVLNGMQQIQEVF